MGLFTLSDEGNSVFSGTVRRTACLAMAKIVNLPPLSASSGCWIRWRHLPNYQLERRADIFFALFLPEYLRDCKGIKIMKDILVPEFPIYNENKNEYKLSYYIDYFALSCDSQKAYLIELKTDMSSVKSDKGRKQLGRLKTASEKKLLHHIKYISDISENSKQWKKYIHLLGHLSSLGLVERVGNEMSKTSLGEVKVVKELEGDEKCGCGRTKGIKDSGVVYIVPSRSELLDWRGFSCELKEFIKQKMEVIEFSDLAEYVKKRGDIGKRFAESLQEWTKQAGSCPPQP